MTTNIQVRITKKVVRSTITKKIVRATFRSTLLTSPAGPTLEYFVAGEMLGGQRAVWMHDGKVWLFDPSNSDTQGRYVGITRTAAVENESVQIVTGGVFVHNSIGLVADEIYFAGAAGVLTATPPAPGICQMVGVARDTNTLLMINNPAVEIIA